MNSVNFSQICYWKYFFILFAGMKVKSFYTIFQLFLVNESISFPDLRFWGKYLGSMRILFQNIINFLYNITFRVCILWDTMFIIFRFRDEAIHIHYALKSFSSLSLIIQTSIGNASSISMKTICEGWNTNTICIIQKPFNHLEYSTWFLYCTLKPVKIKWLEKLWFVLFANLLSFFFKTWDWWQVLLLELTTGYFQ